MDDYNNDMEIRVYESINYYYAYIVARARIIIAEYILYCSVLRARTESNINVNTSVYYYRIVPMCPRLLC